jgi:hypothetical protein
MRSSDQERSPSVARITPRMRLDNIGLFLECNANKALVNGERGKNRLVNRAASLVLAVAMIVFVAFLIWIIVFTASRVGDISNKPQQE